MKHFTLIGFQNIFLFRRRMITLFLVNYFFKCFKPLNMANFVKSIISYPKVLANTYTLLFWIYLTPFLHERLVPWNMGRLIQFHLKLKSILQICSHSRIPEQLHVSFGDSELIQIWVGSLSWEPKLPVSEKLVMQVWRYNVFCKEQPT